jgi:hypothetical protein
VSWYCEAYGPEGIKVGAVCFFQLSRVCSSEGECRDRMAAERQRAYRIIQERAAAGDPEMAHLAEVFAKPADLLNAEDVRGDG